jgi:hypothetical protein
MLDHVSLGVTDLKHAGAVPAVTDIIRATDSLGNFSTAPVTVTIATGVALTPASATVAPKVSQRFTVSGGTETGSRWMLIGITESTITQYGLYTAGPSAGVLDMVLVTDSLGNGANAFVTVGPDVGITPTTATLAPSASQSFSASGGSGTGYTWSLLTNASGATITASGLYTAGAIGEVSDAVGVTDSVGNSAIAIVTVRDRALSVSPGEVTVAPGATERFTALGGSETGYVWTLVANSSGGALTASGIYTAGSNVEASTWSV